MRVMGFFVVAILITWIVGMAAVGVLGSPDGYIVEFVVSLVLGAIAGTLAFE